MLGMTLFEVESLKDLELGLVIVVNQRVVGVFTYDGQTSLTSEYTLPKVRYKALNGIYEISNGKWSPESLNHIHSASMTLPLIDAWNAELYPIGMLGQGEAITVDSVVARRKQLAQGLLDMWADGELSYSMLMKHLEQLDPANLRR